MVFTIVRETTVGESMEKEVVNGDFFSVGRNFTNSDSLRVESVNQEVTRPVERPSYQKSKESLFLFKQGWYIEILT